MTIWYPEIPPNLSSWPGHPLDSSNPLGPCPTLSQVAAAAAVLAAVSFLFTCQSADFTSEAPTLPPQRQVMAENAAAPRKGPES